MSAIRSIARHILMTLPILGIALAAHAETYPSGVIRIVVPTGPGTPPDVIGRVIATELSEAEGWRMVVENKPGALQTIGMSDVLKQPADGYTIYSMSVPTAAVPALMPNLGMRPDVDFTPIVKVSKSYNALVVPPSFPAKSISELVAVLKQNPGKYNFSSAGFGTPAHLIGEMFKLQAGIQAIHVPYQQSQQRIGDLLNGTNHFDFLATVTVADFVESGRLRALGVTAPDRVAGLKDVPTVAEQGFAELVVEDYVGFAVKRGTSGDIVMTLNAAVNKALQKPKVIETLTRLGATPAGGTPDAFGTLVKDQVAYWGRIIRDSGIKMPQ
ncbi:tripartite tricarboxylate transporter substrate binding protein [Bradyrhizobium sp. OAE829]|uniref:Bug family tripartite tricarboxylate transporter substrate binding protein n=1 Tax=Bradyrhizobium sp. OAE829 TaxID=2663807 RepID=UPI00178AE038